MCNNTLEMLDIPGRLTTYSESEPDTLQGIGMCRQMPTVQPHQN